MEKEINMNFLNFNPFNFNPYEKTPKRNPLKHTSIYSDKTFVQNRTKLTTEIEKTVLKKLKERKGSHFEITDTAEIRDIARNQNIQIEDAADMFLVSLIKKNLENIKTELNTQYIERILISQSIDLAETMLNESAVQPGEYRETLLNLLTINP